MSGILEGLPQLVWGRPWSSLVPWRLQPALERLASERLYRRRPPPRIDLRADPSVATLVFAGDLALHNWKETDLPALVFGAVRQVFGDADFGVVNLETVLTTHAEPAGRIGRFLKAAPPSVECLQYLGISAATSANNHALDFGATGLAECGEILRRAGVGWCGVQETDSGDAVPGGLTRELNGVLVGMLAATDHFGGVPTDASPKPVWLEPSQLRRDVRALRTQCHVVVVQLHWGYEYVMYPLRWHRDLARQLVDEGADVVCCHHAHVVMGVERWGRGVIAHGLGNFYFGARRSQHPFGRFGILLRVSVDRAGVVSSDVVPVYTDAAGAVRTESEACPGFDRLCEGLADDAYLDEVQNARVGHDLAQISADLRTRIAGADAVGLLERHAFLHAPRNEWLLTRAEQSVAPDCQRMGVWLKQVRAMSTDAVRRLEIPPAPPMNGVERRLDTRLLPGRWP